MQSVTLKWIGGEHQFALDIGALRALQDAANAGPEEILRRISDGRWRVADLFDTIRLGLICGGMEQTRALALVNDLFSKHPWLHFRLTAQSILMAALVGPEDDPVGETTGAVVLDEPPPESGSSAGSTATAP